jgi:hypothetical protein
MASRGVLRVRGKKGDDVRTCRRRKARCSRLRTLSPALADQVLERARHHYGGV